MQKRKARARLQRVWEKMRHEPDLKSREHSGAKCETVQHPPGSESKWMLQTAWQHPGLLAQSAHDYVC